jgi:hypothetical protein
MEKGPELEKFISDVGQKLRLMMSVEFTQYEPVKINVGIGQGQIELTITLVDKNLLQKSQQRNKIVGARGSFGPPQGQA